MRVFTLGHGADAQPLWQLGGKVLHAVDGNIHVVFEQSRLDLFGEQSLPTNLAEWHVDNLVSGGFDANKINSQFGVQSL